MREPLKTASEISSKSSSNRLADGFEKDSSMSKLPPYPQTPVSRSVNAVSRLSVEDCTDED